MCERLWNKKELAAVRKESRTKSVFSRQGKEVGCYSKSNRKLMGMFKQMSDVIEFAYFKAVTAKIE